MGLYPLSRTVIALLLLSSITAGCLQPFEEEDQNETELSSYLLTVEKTSVATTPSSIIDFEELTPRQRNTFERALNESYHSARVPTDVNYEVWIEHDHVRYRNETYSVNVAVP